jgi:hypothetical protein
VLPPYCPPWATRLTFPFTMALSRGCSLPLSSPLGLPSAGYPASPRWYVFRFQVRFLSLRLTHPPIKKQLKNITPMVFNY